MLGERKIANPLIDPEIVVLEPKRRASYEAAQTTERFPARQNGRPAAQYGVISLLN